MIAAIFRNEDLLKATEIMKRHNSKLRYSMLRMNGVDYYIVDQGPIAGLAEIRSRLSRREDLELFKI